MLGSNPAPIILCMSLAKPPHRLVSMRFFTARQRKRWKQDLRS